MADRSLQWLGERPASEGLERSALERLTEALVNLRFAVRTLEASEAQWLQDPLSQATSPTGRACVLSIMDKP